mgnify:CR=1 FL=1
MNSGQKFNIRAFFPVLVLSLLLFLGISLVSGYYKSYLYEDEVLSYTAANSLNGLRPKYERYTLTDAKEFVRNALTVDTEHRFDYSNVAANTADDPHPPLYLFLLHTLSSLMPGVFSKWTALGINIVSGIFILVFVNYAASKIFERRSSRYASVLILTLSAGFMDKITFLRMYPMMTVFTMLLFCSYLKLFDQENAWEGRRQALKSGLILLVNIVVGTLTHYYFLIFAFFAAAFYSLWLLKYKKIKAFISHILTYVSAAVISIMLFPAMIWQISSSDPMSESAKGALGISVLVKRIGKMFVAFNIDFFSGYFKYLLLAFLILLIYILLYEKQRISLKISVKIIFTAVITVFYFALVSMTTPYVSSRYLTAIYPLVVILLVYFAEPLLNSIFKNFSFGMALFIALCALPLYMEFSSGLKDTNKAEMQRISKEYSKDYCITWSGMTLEENYFELENYAGLFKIKLNDEDAPESIDSRVADAKELVVYVPEGKDPQVYLDYLKRYVKGIDGYTLLYKAYYADAYLMN